ncbi:MAG: type 11 methyltransferase [Promethearchaeota archaeon CR_4]|nr:MAG: type 11 methyltransferase [Candidatus Lokiarchaeota archaeon CR_4]
MNFFYDPYVEREEFLKFGRIKNTNLLDLGAGSGQLAQIAAGELGCHVTCIDPSPEKLERAGKHLDNPDLLKRIHFKQGDARSLSYANDSFNCVTCYSVLHHIKHEEREQVVLEASRVAREKILFAELNLEGAKYFDEVLHPGERHQEKLVYSDWLLSKTSRLGKITFFSRKFTYFVLLEKIKKMI